MRGRAFNFGEMNWKVTYRAKGGKLATETFEAKSREHLFTILDKRKICVVKVEQANSRDKAPKSGLTKLFIWGIAGIVVAVGAFFIYRVLQQSSFELKFGPETPESSQKPIATVSPSLQEADPQPETPSQVVTPEERNEGIDAARRQGYDGSAIDMDTYVSPDPGFSNRWERFKAEQAKLPFKYMSENEIAVVLDTKPGEMVLDTAFLPNFEQDFLKSLEEAIIPLETDDEKTAQLKRDVVQAKIILKEAYDNGESITDILREERDQLIKIYGLRETLFRELKEVEKNASSTQEIDDFVSAANLMLDEYGAQHIKLPYSRERLRLERAEGLIP